MTSVLILAGTRNESCLLCNEAGVDSKGLIPLGGVRMIDHVLRALRDASELTGEIWVSGLAPEAILDGLPADLAEFGGRLRAAPSGKGPAAATLATLEGGASLPLLVTTCDHPLLSPSMISSFLGQSYERDCDFTVGLASRPVIEKAYPDVQRTYLRLGGAGYSGCNLFLVRTAEGCKAAEFWRDVGHDRKRPLKLAQRFGYGAVLRMLTGRLHLEAAFRHGSKRVGAQIAPIVIPIAEAAIDVDKPSDLVLVSQILDKAA